MNASAELLKELRIDRKAPPPPPRRGLWLGVGVAALVVLLLALGGWWLFGRPAPLAVRTDTVVAIGSGGPAAAASVLDATGYVVARRMATVSAKVTGKVREVLIEEGQHVEAGQVLATLDPVDAAAQRELAESQLAAARSQSGSVQAQLREAESQARRLGTLAQQQLVSKSQYEQAVAQRDALRAQLATARRNAGVAADQLRIARLGVDHTIVRAPFAGVVIAKAAQEGEIISPLSAGGGFTRTGIGTIVDMDSLEVEVDVGEQYIGRVKPGMPVQATLNAYPDWKIPAHVVAIIPAADRGKATVKVRIALDEKDERIVPEMGVAVSFLEKPQPRDDAAAPPRGVRAPAAAITERDGSDVAFVVSGEGTVELREVEVGRALGTNGTQVLAGLSAGEDVVLDPPAELEDGSRVAVTTR
jgi:RND family efflux transporter MFP subunit